MILKLLPIFTACFACSVAAHQFMAWMVHTTMFERSHYALTGWFTTTVMAIAGTLVVYLLKGEK